jgi:lambda family phage tail tape measure protein
MTAKESVKNKTVEDAKKLDEQRIAQIKAVNEQYAALTAGVRSNTEVLKDKSAEEQAKSIARLGEQTKKVIEGSKEFVTSQDDIIAKRAIAVELEKQTAGLFGAEAARIRAQIEMQQSHITKLSELEVAAAKARVALQELNGMSSTDPEYLRAKESVANAEKALTDAKVKSQTASEKAGFDAVQKYQDVSTQRLNAYGQSFEKMFSGMADAIVEFAKTGKLNFSDLVNSMLSDILRFEAKRMTMAAYEGMGGAAGIFKMFGGSSGTTLSQYDYAVQSGFANGGAFNNGIQAFANGGAFTNSIVSEPTLFKFAKGTGLMGEAGPEAIMPLRRGSDGSLGVAASGASGGNVSVQVINNSNAQATTQETTDSKGNRKIEVIIGDMTAGEISRSGSASQKSIKSTFGLQPQLIRR